MACLFYSPRTWSFVSFHGPDVHKSSLNHLRRLFNKNGILMFDDQGIERGQTITPAIKQAIRESIISIVVLTKNYASSSWCLDELLEILECIKASEQIVIPVLYGVQGCDVQTQTGYFGEVFEKTCRGKTEEQKKRWCQALADVSRLIAFTFPFISRLNESEMFEKIGREVSVMSKRVFHNEKFLIVVINMLLEISSAVADQLSSIRKPYFARISLVMSILSLILSIFEGKTRARTGNRIFASSTDIILYFCVVGQLIVSTINISFTETGRDGPIKISLWPVFFAIGMVVSKFFEKQPSGLKIE